MLTLGIIPSFIERFRPRHSSTVGAFGFLIISTVVEKDEPDGLLSTDGAGGFLPGVPLGRSGMRDHPSPRGF
jgi:hypothetical protein